MQTTAAPTRWDACVIMNVTHHSERRHRKDKFTQKNSNRIRSLGGSGSAIFWTSEGFQLRICLQTTNRGRYIVKVPVEGSFLTLMSSLMRKHTFSVAHGKESAGNNQSLKLTSVIHLLLALLSDFHQLNVKIDLWKVLVHNITSQVCVVLPKSWENTLKNTLKNTPKYPRKRLNGAKTGN